MLVALPLLAFLLLWIYSGNTRREPLWRASFIQAVIIWGAYMVVVTELLSLFRAVTRLSLALAWGAMVLGGAIWIFVWLKRKHVLRLPIIYRGKGKRVAVLDVLVLALTITTLVIGFIAPPNSQEAMSFGMTRVAYWAQNQSLAHFATLNENLNSAPPGQGIALLNFYLLAGSDRWSNFIAWGAWLACIQAVMAIAGFFKANQAGQRLAAIFAATLPIALALSSGSLDDMLSTLWVVSYVLIVFFFDKDPNHTFNLLLAGLAAGLAFVTKPISLIILVPFAIYFLILQARQFGFGKLVQRTAAGVLILFVIAGGFFYRNLQTFRMFYQYEAYIRDLNTVTGPKVFASNLVRNNSLHADLPFTRANYWIYQRIVALHEKMQMDVSDPRITEGSFMVPPLNTSEMTSGNPLHFLLFSACSIALVAGVLIKKQGQQLLAYLGLLGLSVIFFLLFFKWQPDGSRLHLLFYMIGAPIIGYMLGWLDDKKPRWGTIIAAVLGFFAWPWALLVYERPVFVMPGLTSDLPISRANRDELYFVTDPGADPVFTSLAAELNATGASTVIGVDMGLEHHEYPIWALTRKPNDRVQIQNMRASPLMQRYTLNEYEPDYILSDTCGQEYTGYTLSTEANGLCYFKRVR